MEKNKEIDFYGMGMRKVNDIYEETDKIANEIEKVYGLDARLQYECGVSIAMGKKSVGKLSNMFDQDIIHIVNNSSPDLRNNSYFGGCGVSKKYNEDGSYNEPSGFSKVKKN